MLSGALDQDLYYQKELTKFVQIWLQCPVKSVIYAAEYRHIGQGKKVNNHPEKVGWQ